MVAADIELAGPSRPSALGVQPFPLKVLDDTKTTFGPPDQMQIIATKGWSAANPESAGRLKNFKITPEQLSDLMLKI